jgi:hypothetical protein
VTNLFTDNFVAALDTNYTFNAGGVWSVPSGGTAGFCRNAAVGGFLWLATAIAQHAAVADVRVTVTRVAGTDEAGVLVRFSGTGGAETCYLLDSYDVNTHDLYRCNAGSLTLLASFTSAFAATNSMSLEAIGTGATVTLNAFINGVQIGTFADTSGSRITAAGQTAMATFAVGNFDFDGFTVDTATAPAAGPVFKAASTPQTATAATIALNVPASPANDDFLIAVVYAIPPAVTLTAPAGWTEVGTRTDFGSDYSKSMYIRRGLSSDTNFTFGGTGITTIKGAICSYTGVQTTGTALQAVDVFSSGLTGTSTSAQGNGVTTTNINRLLVYTEVNFTAVNATPPSGMTERVDTGNIYFADVDLPTAGASGAKTATLGSSAKWATRNIALKPLVSPGASAKIIWQTVLRIMAGF